MDSDRFDSMVQTLETRQRRNPRGFLWGTGALAFTGFFYLLLVLLVSTALTLGIVALVVSHPNAATLKLGLFGGLLCGGLALAILRALWVRLHPPSGITLTRQNAPALMALVASLRRRIGSAAFHRILLDGQYNASVTQIPRLGVFGWHRNYLMLGLPLLQSMTPGEFEAVLAHEFAHLAGGHGRFGNWLYRLRRSWETLFHHLEQQKTGGTRILTVFLDWFWPRFNARAFVLSRANEYEADALAARVAGAENIAGALKRLAIYDRHLHESFWDGIQRRNTIEPEPPADVFTEMAVQLRAGPDPASAEKWMRQAYLTLTTTQDTHPCLRERLAALGQLPEEDRQSELPPLVGESAAEALLGAGGHHFSATLGAQWSEAVRADWTTRHTEARRLASTLEAPPSAEAAPIEELWKKADALATLHGPGAAQATFAQILAIDPNHAGALFGRGAHRLHTDDPDGVTDLEHAITLDAGWTAQGLQLLAQYHHRHGDKAALRAIERRMEIHQQTMQAAQTEREVVTPADRLLPHQLSSEDLASLAAALAPEPFVAAAWCARKETAHHTAIPMHVIALALRVPWWRPTSSSLSNAVTDRVVSRLQITGTFLVFVREKDLRSVGNAVAAVPGSSAWNRNDATRSSPAR